LEKLEEEMVREVLTMGRKIVHLQILSEKSADIVFRTDANAEDKIEIVVSFLQYWNGQAKINQRGTGGIVFRNTIKTHNRKKLIKFISKKFTLLNNFASLPAGRQSKIKI